MYYDNDYSLKNKIILFISLVFIVISIFTQVNDFNSNREEYNVSYEYVNIKDMAQPKVVEKTATEENVFDTIENVINGMGPVEEIPIEQSVSPVKKVEPVLLEPVNNSRAVTPPRNPWRLPIEMGNISQYPTPGHAAYDMTSPRGYAETIHPVANGVVSGIYTDVYGALIVTVKHNVNGKIYTSQYVHLSSYAPGLYVGKEVTINDSLGQMGSTGNSTGVHLHIAVLDCELFNPADPSCPDLNAWFRYGSNRIYENFYGLGVLVYVPDSWYNFNE